MHTQEEIYLIEELSRELSAHRDGPGRNLIARCPYCGKDGKYGVYIGLETSRKKPFMAHCFSCGASTHSLERTLEALGRMDLLPTRTASLDGQLECSLLFPLEQVEEVDDELGIVELPEFYRRTFLHPYLKGRGFTADDYEFFPVGTTRGLNFRYDDYVIFPVIDSGDTVGYVARHLWPKAEIDAYNRRAKLTGDYSIRRFRNSTQNDFVKLLYNYDVVREGKTETVILCEGIFDVVALTRKLDLYENGRVAVVATFGKKISQAQIYKLQTKGVSNVVVGYDGDAVDATKKTAEELSRYFEVLVADIPDPEKDWEDLTQREIYDIFAYRLRTPVEYKICKIQQL
ncbi:hypothetical protein A3BBH6_05780 [Alistipes onderdonkii subsp. vulgaris]|uniref:toprim domain-containing protein n=1 Tax=Alistipes onderdonkii TaxID=328813 RepID=UPI001164D4B0|nr:toprim domain-containing protein [Alistipes onderdonkii]BBL00342.1 hypothetical protein A3BBH6_05780 [Alistipes onderdonkii subsp. vulgaris]